MSVYIYVGCWSGYEFECGSRYMYMGVGVDVEVDVEVGVCIRVCL